VKGIAAHEGLSWEHVRLMRERWKGTFVLKGLLSPSDVALAREHGVDGVILSNHGGRQLDYAASPMQVLAAAMTEARGMTVMIDSGFRRGTDVLKALALGAQCVFVGRPFLFAAVYAACPGVSHGISLLSKEIDRDMAMLGLRRIGEMRPDLLIDAPAAA
jgi:L-lactate dehydrogenase (cytochrome)